MSHSIATVEKDSTDARSRRAPRRWDIVTWVLVGVVLTGTAIRFVGIGWGLPLLLHPDEWVVVEYAIDLAQRNSFEPDFFFRPDHLEIQLSYLAYLVWGHVFNGMPPEELYLTSVAPFYAISRGITALFGSAMIPLAYLIGRPFGRWAGLLMALGVALFPPFVEHSRYATPDIPLTFTVMLVVLGCVLYIRGQSWWALVLACAGVALGITAKYPAVLGTTVIAAAIIIAATRSHQPWRILSRGAAAIGMVVGMVFTLSPVLFTNITEAKDALFAQNLNGHLGASGLNWPEKLAFYTNEMLQSGGLLLLLFAFAGIAWLIVRRRWDGVPLAIGFVYWVALSALNLHWERWGLPMYLSVVLLSGLGVYALWGWALAFRGRMRLARGAVAVLAGVSGLSLLMGSIAHAAYALAPDTRTAAGPQAALLGSTRENTVFDGYTSFDPDGTASVVKTLKVTDGRVESRDGTNYEFVMTSSRLVGRFLADPSLEEPHELYTTIIDTLPVVAQWDAAGSPPDSPWEVVRIVRLVPYLIQLGQGAMVGPQLILYGVHVPY